jgi:hypothetical protein
VKGNTMEYNLNLPMKIRLTTKGITVLEKYHYEKIRRYNLPWKQFRMPETDKDGWTKFEQAATVFEIFGGYSWLCNEPFGMEVKFEE